MMHDIRPEEILKQAQGFMESRILLSAAELNLFTILQPAPLSAKETAGRVGADARALTFLLDALVAMEFLVKKGQSYQCLQPASALLVEDSPHSVLPMILHACSLWRRWSRSDCGDSSTSRVWDRGRGPCISRQAGPGRVPPNQARYA